MPNFRLAYLLNNYILQKCTAYEKEELMSLLSDTDNKDTVHLIIKQVLESSGSKTEMPEQIAGEILQNIIQSDKGISSINKKTVFNLWKKMVAAAVVILLMSGMIYFYSGKKENKTDATVAAADIQPARILPGGNKARLILADGRAILLDSAHNGALALQGTTNIKKQEGLITYDDEITGSNKTKIEYNTLSTPRGGQYQLALPDGTRVWLNAASSLHFPTSFPDNQREVNLTGEAYFEVAKDKKKPFLVKTNNMTVEVLGTHFNVNAYADENTIRTSLLEGSVKIIKDNLSDWLKPGQQAILNKQNKEEQIEITNVDIDEVIAWKNGLFQFGSADITAIMRQIGRWYDVDVSFLNKTPARRYEGTISRNARLSDVLKILELSGIKFEIDGKKIIVQ